MKKGLAKMLALLMVSVMLISSMGMISVSAAETPTVVKAQGKTLIEAENYSERSHYYTGMKNYVRNISSSNPSYPNEGAMLLDDPQKKILVYYVDVEEAGTYKLNMYMAGAGLKTIDICVGEADHQEHYLRGYVSRAMMYTESAKTEEFYGGTLELKKGPTYISIQKLTGKGSQEFFYFTLERVKKPVDQTKKSGSFKTHIVPGIIQAEDFDRGETGSFGTGASGTYSADKPKFVTAHREDSNVAIEPKANGNYDLWLNDGEWVNYTFNVNRADTYTLSLGAEWKGEVGVYLDGSEDAYIGKTITSEKVEETKVASFYLDKGKHTITLKSHDFRTKRPRIDYIKLERGDLIEKVEKIDTGIYKEFYVSTNGNDTTGDGSKENPFATLARAKDEVAKVNDDMTGDIIVYVEPGEYKLEETLYLTEKDSGKNGHNVIYKSASAFEQPLLSGGQRVTGWEPYKDGIWSAPLTGQEYVRNLYINEIPAARARSKYINMNTKYGPNEHTGDVVGYVMDKANSFVDFARPQDMEICWTRHWEREEVPIKEIKDLGDQWLIIPALDFTKEWGNKDKTHEGYFENAMELLDEPGEFYFNPEQKRIYYYPFHEEDLTKDITYVGDTEKLIKLKGESLNNKVENVVFDGFRIMYGAWNFASKYGYVGTQSDGSLNEKTYRIDQFAGQVELDNADNITIKNCELACLGSAGINAFHNVTNLKIDGNIIRDISGTGIKVGCQQYIDEQNRKDREVCEDIEITNNYITRIGGEFYNNCGISIIYACNTKILHNVIKDTPYSGMHLNWGWNTEKEWVGGGFEVSHNRIESVMQMTRDGGGTYIYGETHGAVFSYNYYKDHDAPFDGPMLYNDSGAKHVEYHHNVVEDAGDFIGYPSEGYVYSDQNFHDNYAYNCYKIWGTRRDYPEEMNFNIEPPYEIRPGDEWPQEALDIIAGAGLSPEYKHLEEKVKEYPDWRPHRNSYVPEETFKAKKKTWGIHMEAEDYMLGGEGVGYHKIVPVNRYQGFRAEMDVDFYYFADLEGGTYVLATNDAGEWTKYEFEVPESGYYKLQWNGNSIQRSVTDGNFKENAILYVDDVEIARVTSPWIKEEDANYGNFRTIECGEFYLEKGKHTFKMELIFAHYFNWAKFYTDEMKEEWEREQANAEIGIFENHPDYKEAVITPYEESIARLNAVKEERATMGGMDMAEFWAKNPHITTALPIVSNFKDLNDSKWAVESINALFEKGIISDNEEKAYRPNDSITREEFVKLIVLAAGLPTDNNKTDLKDVEKGAWYYPYVATAVANGIITGDDDGNFRIGESISRQDMAVIIVRTLDKIGHKYSTESTAFSDDAQIAGYAKSAMYAAKNLGIINGVGDNMCAPQGTANRAMSAKVIFEMIKAAGLK